MTKVYVVIEEADDNWEGEYILGIFSTREKAEAYLDKIGWKRLGSYHITEYDVDPKEDEE